MPSPCPALFLAEGLQIGMGYQRNLALHVPLGVSSWSPCCRRRPVAGSGSPARAARPRSGDDEGPISRRAALTGALGLVGGALLGSTGGCANPFRDQTARLLASTRPCRSGSPSRSWCPR